MNYPPLSPLGCPGYSAIGSAAGIELHGGMEEPLAPASFVFRESAHSQKIQNEGQGFSKCAVGGNGPVMQPVLVILL